MAITLKSTKRTDEFITVIVLCFPFFSFWFRFGSHEIVKKNRA